MTDDHLRKLKRIRSAWRRRILSAALDALIWAGAAYDYLASVTVKRLVLPVAAAQLALAVLSVHKGGTLGLIEFAVGTVALVGLAMLPLTVRHEWPKAHWVQSCPDNPIIERRKKERT